MPIIALSQLNRTTESRGGSKRPQLSDLRESGAIEQDADIVAFIHRPEYYGMTVTEEGVPTAGMAEIIVAKHRNGAVDTINLRFLNDQARFADMDTAGVALGGGTAPASQQYEDYASEGMTGGAPMGDPLGALPNNEFDISMPAPTEDVPF